MKGLLCWFLGHRDWPTGKKTIGLYQTECLRCGGLAVASLDNPELTLPWSHYWEMYFRQEEGK